MFKYTIGYIIIMDIHKSIVNICLYESEAFYSLFFIQIISLVGRGCCRVVVGKAAIWKIPKLIMK